MAQLEGDETHNKEDGDNLRVLTDRLKSKQLWYILDIITNYDEDLSLESLLECSSDDIKGLIDEINSDDTNQHNIAVSKKIKFAKMIASHAESIKVDTNTKVVRVILGEEEEEAMNDLDLYQDKIASFIGKVNERNQKLSENLKQCDAEIESKFNSLIDQIQAQKQTMKHNLQEISQMAQSKISSTLQVLHDEQKQINRAIHKCNEWMQNAKIGRNKRKEHILDSYNKINKKKLGDDLTAINVDIYSDFVQKEAVSSFVSNICVLYAREKHPLPIIQNVECKSIAATGAIIHFDASLAEKDKQKKVDSILLFKIECNNNDIEEKEKESISSDLFVFEKSQKHNECKLKDLTQNKQYTFSINVFEGQKDNDSQAVKRKDHEAVVINFKNTERHFVYQSDFDANGICYYLATNNNQREWKNPADEGLITVTSSGMNAGEHNRFLDRKATQNNWTHNQQPSWFCVDFGKRLKIKPSAYTLRHDTYPGYFIRNWNLEASNDGNDWSVIKQHANDASISAAAQSHTWMITDCNASYRMFRINLTGTNSSGHWYLMCQGFEIYGYLQ